MDTIKLDKAFHLAVLKHHDSPIITNADLYSILLKLYREKSFEGVRIGKIKNDCPEIETYKYKVNALENSGIITPLINTKAYVISGKGEPSAEQAGCYLYPFSYLCYLSAMDYHGLTDRLPKLVHLMIPDPTQSASLGQSEYSADNIYSKSRNIKINKKIEGKEFVYHKSKGFLVYKEINGSGGVRVSSIGRTFLDMFKKPVHCGGFNHVLDILEESGTRYLKLILKEFDMYGSNIDKSRLGFILEEVLGVKDLILDRWASTAQRGSSRVLVPGEKFAPYFSERWCISINKEDMQVYGTRN